MKFPRTLYLHILHEQLSPFHSLIDLLKLALVARLFIESDKVFQRMAPLKDNESFDVCECVSFIFKVKPGHVLVIRYEGPKGRYEIVENSDLFTYRVHIV